MKGALFTNILIIRGHRYVLEYDIDAGMFQQIILFASFVSKSVRAVDPLPAFPFMRFPIVFNVASYECFMTVSCEWKTFLIR